MGRRIFVLVVGLVLVAAMGNSRSLAALGMSGGAAEESEADTVRSTLVNGAQPRFAVPQGLATTEGDFVVKDFGFRDGESLAELRLHYATLGKPIRDSAGHVVNGVMLLHGTGGSGAQFLQPQFAGELFGAGQLLDTAKYYIILPDGIGHGKSSKPSDGLHATFPQYDYDDMVAAHHALAEHLGVEHLRLILGTSMGCMHSFVWGETYPEFMDALMPLACQPAQIAGRNRVWRKMVMDAIREDPEWKGGEYAKEPQQGLRTALDLLLIAGSAPLQMQKTLPTRDAAAKERQTGPPRESSRMSSSIPPVHKQSALQSSAAPKCLVSCCFCDVPKKLAKAIADSRRSTADRGRFCDGLEICLIEKPCHAPV